MQGLINDWLRAKEEVTKTIARDFINQVRKVLVEKSIPLDKGNRDFGRICGVQEEVHLDNNREKADKRTSLLDCNYNTDCLTDQGTSSEDVNFVRQWKRSSKPTGSIQSRKNTWDPKSQTRRLAYFVCGSTQHFQRTCPSQYCQSCGKKGHDRKDCYSKKPIYSINSRSTQKPNSRGWHNESSVLIEVKLNGISCKALINSGAQPSIIDARSLESIGKGYQYSPNRVHGVCAIPIKTSYVELEVGIERSKETLTHKFLVLDSPERTIILGRDFLIRFKSTEFDWNEGRIRLGEIWLSTEASIWGGQVLSRAEMVKYMFVEHNENTSRNGWNISPTWILLSRGS